jgi:hypothetical protein
VVASVAVARLRRQPEALRRKIPKGIHESKGEECCGECRRGVLGGGRLSRFADF